MPTLQENFNELKKMIEAICTENAEQRTEIERLKKALENCANGILEANSESDYMRLYDKLVEAMQTPQASDFVAPDEPDLSFTAHDDATSNGCRMCGNEWKSLNKKGYCSNCWAIWNS